MLGNHKCSLLEFLESITSPHYVVSAKEWSDYRSTTIPISIHVDGIEIFAGVEYFVYSWSSSLTHDIDSYDMQFPVLIVEAAACTSDTVADIVEVLKWSLDVMEYGRFPSADHVGSPLTGQRAARAVCRPNRSVA